MVKTSCNSVVPISACIWRNVELGLSLPAFRLGLGRVRRIKAPGWRSFPLAMFGKDDIGLPCSHFRNRASIQRQYRPEFAELRDSCERVAR